MDLPLWKKDKRKGKVGNEVEKRAVYKVGENVIECKACRTPPLE